MLFFNNGKIYAKVWQVVEKTDKYIDLRVTTSEKLQDGTYKNSSWFPRVIGHAYNSLKDVKETDTLIITKAKLTNEMYIDKEGKKKSAFKLLILESELALGDDTAANSPAINTPAPAAPQVDDNPW